MTSETRGYEEPLTSDEENRLDAAKKKFEYVKVSKEVGRRVEGAAQNLMTKGKARERASEMADETLQSKAREIAEEEALFLSSHEKGMDTEYREYIERKTMLMALEGKMEMLQHDIQEAESQLDKVQETHDKRESGSWLSRVSNFIAGNADLKKKVVVAKEEIAKKELALSETNKEYADENERQRELEEKLK